ncbi:MAG TPA: hypothetical protein VHH73_16435, partial [Verrucomicrobiae bacterium]|nr:hypothetical protein [Verrucomicrobiae bacterium]
GTRDAKAQHGPVKTEWLSYGRYYRRYSYDLYFLIRHFHGSQRWRWIWQSYRIYVGLSRWPWRLLAKNFLFLVALLRAHFLVFANRPPYFEPAQSQIDH